MNGALLLLGLLVSSGCEGSIDSAPTGPGQILPAGGSGPANPAGAGGTAPTSDAPSSRFYRLSHAQWETTTRDLLGLPTTPNLASSFSKDAVDSFSNNGAALSVADQLRQDYQRAAETLAAEIAGDPALMANLIPEGAPADLDGRARAFIQALGLRAHRRPLSDLELEEYVALFSRGADLEPASDAFTSGARLVLEAMLQSPFFLYRTELGADGARLDDHEVAAKLSYAVSGTMPDAALLAAAAAGSLRTSAGVSLEATRLLSSGDGPSRAFHNQLFGIGDFDQIQKDEALVPVWNPTLAESMREESERFVSEVFTSGGTLTDLLLSPFTYVDANLAPLYDLPAPSGTGFVRVELDPSRRAGFLTRLGFLAKFAGSIDPDPIHRGAFINERILCVDLPPPTVTVFPEPPEGLVTNRERVDALTGEGTCGATCHGIWMNPAGFAFEHYDGVGRYRTEDNGAPVNAADTYPFSEGPKSYQNAVEFSRALAETADSHACYAEHWLTYLNGRALRPTDAPVVELVARASLEGAPIQQIVLQAVTHDGFVTR